VAVGCHAPSHEWLPHADWVELDGVGHSAQLEVPLEAAQLILGVHGRLMTGVRFRRS
jgi:pimeloyl-ACP methyl ester carboxylesterase